ncbi:MAG: glycosyltransferase family 2 protein [Lacisediminihabitans sp.]
MATHSDPSKAPTVGVITVSYGSENVLEGFLASVRDASGNEITTIVADNRPGPSGGVEALCHAIGATYLPMASNLGYGGAMNLAAAALPPSVEWVLVSNPDVTLGPGVIDELIRVGGEDPAIGSVGPAIHNSDGSLYPSARSVPSLRTGIGHAMFANLWTGNPWTKAYRKDTELDPKRRDAGWLSGACVLVRRTAFEELGGFDPAYFMYFEDVDLGFRLGKKGYRNVYAPSAHVVHSGAHATTSESAQMVRTHHESARIFLARKYAGPWLWPVRAVLTIGLQLRSTLIRRSLRH